MDDNHLVVGGYKYSLKEDAELARQEALKIEYLEKNMDYRKPENVLTVYKKALDNRIFRTPTGWEYLRKLQNRLKDTQNTDQKFPPIELLITFSYKRSNEQKVSTPRIIPGKKEQYKGKFRLSLIINIVLAVSVVLMFVIALNSKLPNILNYENNIVNKYSHWEQQLTEREYRIRELEKSWSEKME